MPSIMSMLVFQNSRRQLLANLTQMFDEAMEHLKEEPEPSKQNEAGEGDQEDNKARERRIDNLKRAARAADDECKKLEYWSDIRNLTQNGKVPDATDPEKGWDPKRWEGLDGSGADW